MLATAAANLTQSGFDWTTFTSELNRPAVPAKLELIIG